MLANGLAHEFDGCATGKVRRVGPAGQGSSLGHGGLALGNQQRLRCAGEDGHILPRSPAEGAGQLGPLHRLAGDRGDAQQFTLRLRQQIGQTERVVDVTADVGVEK